MSDISTTINVKEERTSIVVSEVHAPSTEVIAVREQQTIEVVEGVLYLKGEGDLTFLFNASAATSFNITHNMLKYPSVTILDSSGREIEADIVHVDDRIIQCNFSQPFSGKISLN